MVWTTSPVFTKIIYLCNSLLDKFNSEQLLLKNKLKLPFTCIVMSISECSNIYVNKSLSHTPKVKIFKNSSLFMHQYTFYNAQTKCTQHKSMLKPEYKGRWLHLLVILEHCELLMHSKRQFCLFWATYPQFLDLQLE